MISIQKLRDMNLHAVADELEELRAKLAAMETELAELRAYKEAAENQEPDCWRITHRSFCGIVTDKKEIAEDPFYSGCVFPLYAKPVPADKPAVAVPDCLKYFVDHDFHQLPVYEDGRTPLILTEEQYNAIQNLLAAPSHSQQSALEPVEGDLLPPVGTNVAIHLASNDKWVNHKVVGYYVWGPLGGVSDSYSRVFVRVVDGCGVQNARLLKDIKWDRCPSHESEQGEQQ